MVFSKKPRKKRLRHKKTAIHKRKSRGRPKAKKRIQWRRQKKQKR